jgi:hypothetical protein
MNKFVSTVLAAVLAVFVSVPAFAAPSADGDGDTVTKRFELTISGKVPAGQAFVLGFLEQGKSPTDSQAVIVCGDFSSIDAAAAEDLKQEMGKEMDMMQNIDIISDKPCQGGEGTVYSYDVDFERGTGIAFFFARVNLTNPEDIEVIASSDLDANGVPTEFETLNEDIVNAVEYNFDAARAQLPGTGLSDTLGRFGLLAAALSLVALGGVVRRFLPQV